MININDFHLCFLGYDKIIRCILKNAGEELELYRDSMDRIPLYDAARSSAGDDEDDDCRIECIIAFIQLKMYMGVRDIR